jgi:formylglycine-generating enzyme required for sulfatase activity
MNKNLAVAMLLAAMLLLLIPLQSFSQQSDKRQSAAGEMVFIEGGTFTMGSPAAEPDRDDDEIQHGVTVSSFYMGKYEVTQKEWYEVMGTTVRQQRNKANSSWKIYGEGDNYPMYYVSWYELIEYCNKRSEMEGLTPVYTINKNRHDPNNKAPATGKFARQNDSIRWLVTWNRNADGYRLPTEAEWEYACRDGKTTPFSTGNNITTDQANYNGNYPYSGNAKGTYRGETRPVGSFAPNAWGIYDLHGNVGEWCWDWHGGYTRGAQTDPMGARSGSSRAIRGGSWSHGARDLRSANRYGYSPAYRYSHLGFRLARSGF